MIIYLPPPPPTEIGCDIPPYQLKPYKEMSYLKDLIKAEGGTQRAAFGDLKIIRVKAEKIEQEDKDTFQLSGEVDVLVMIPVKDTKTKSGKEWKKGHYLVVEVQGE